MATLQLQVPVNPQYARLVRERLLDFGTRCGVARYDLEELLVAVGEAFANAVEHAGTPEPIEIEIRLEEPDKLVATVADHGRGFAAAEAARDLPPAAAERGRGIPLMRRSCDLFSLRSRLGRGTRVELGRYLRRPVALAEGCQRGIAAKPA
jgi:anti-sigma regulatory factor (Ser/Thr protein kinase)